MDAHGINMICSSFLSGEDITFADLYRFIMRIAGYPTCVFPKQHKRTQKASMEILLNLPSMMHERPSRFYQMMNSNAIKHSYFILVFLPETAVEEHSFVWRHQVPQAPKGSAAARKRLSRSPTARVRRLSTGGIHRGVTSVGQSYAGYLPPPLK